MDETFFPAVKPLFSLIAGLRQALAGIGKEITNSAANTYYWENLKLRI
jgi:hypothetical protein